MQHSDRFSFFALFVLIVSAWGGLLYGYHTAVISGVLASLNISFHLTVVDESILVSIVLLGGLFGALFAGVLADRFGRKKILVFTALIFCVSALIMGYASSYFLFLSGRLISGFAVGLTSVITPMYLAEIAPPHYRGRFVCVFQLMLALGILFAYGVNMALVEQSGWRPVFFISFIPAALQLIGLFFLPETPAWLLRHHENREAISTLDHLRDDKSWKNELADMKKSASKHKSTFSQLWQPKIRYVVIVGILLSIFQQITGVNTIIYYAPRIFNLSGASSTQSTLIATFAVGIANTLATLISIWLLDSLGRRRLLLFGVSGMILCQILLVIGFSLKNESVLSMIGVLGFVFCFAIALGPITWVVISEIYPLKIRGKAMGLAIFANWLSNYIVALTFLILIEKLTSIGTFSLYTFISIVAFVFIYRFVPETKGKSLEEIETMVMNGNFK